MPPLNVFAYTNVAALLAAWLAQGPAEGTDARVRWLGKRIGCKRPQVWHLLNGSRDVQPRQVARLGRALGLEGEELAYLRLLAAWPTAPAHEMKALRASMWSAHAAKMGLPDSAVEALVARRPIPMSSESALLALLPVLVDPGSSPSARALEELLWSPPDPGVLRAALELAEQGGSVGEQLSPRLLVMRATAEPESRDAAAMHGLLEVARDGLLAVPATDRDYHTLVWSADAQAESECKAATAELDHDLRELVRETAEERVGRVYLLWTEQMCMSALPLPETKGAGGERAPAGLSGGGDSSRRGVDLPDLSSVARPCLYLYLDFVDYARAWTAWRRARGLPCSATWLGRRMGVSKSMAYYLVTGASPLWPEHLEGLRRAFSFSTEELAYVDGMIQHRTAADLAEKAWTRKALLDFGAARGVRTVEGEAFRVAAHWAPFAIHALAHLRGFQDDPVWISAALRGLICEEDAADQMVALVTTGMLAPQPLGPARPAIPVETNLPEIQNLARFALHDSMLCLVQDDLRRPAADPRASARVIAMPESALPRLRALLNAYKDRILRVLQASDARSSVQDRVLLIGMQFRPLTHPLVTSLAPRT